MPPKPKFTREEIINAALRLVRENGEAALTSRDVGRSLGCSARPVFTAFDSMAELKACTVCAGMEIYEKMQEEELKKYPPYKAMGMAYIRLAREEGNLFRFLFMRDRTNEPIPISHADSTISAVKEVTSLEDDNKANLFQTEMWTCVHGIATMIATSYLNLDEKFISSMVTDIFMGLKERHGIK